MCGYLSMNEHVCDENAWEWLRMECMRMTEDDWESLIFKEGVVVILGWYTLYDMHDTVCVMRMHDNEWECMGITHTLGGVLVILSWYAIHDIHQNALYYLTMNEHVCDENAWECMRMECMRMTEDDWESLIFKEGVVVILCWHTLYDMHDTVWEWLRMTENRLYSRRGRWSF